MVARFENVSYIPVQAVVPTDGKQTALVKTASGVETRELEVGEFNDEFIEIKKGLVPGEKVQLKRSSKSQAGESGPSEKTPGEKGSSSPGASAPASKSS